MSGSTSRSSSSIPTLNGSPVPKAWLVAAQLGGRRVDLGPVAHGVSPSAARAAMRPNTSAAASPLA